MRSYLVKVNPFSSVISMIIRYKQTDTLLLNSIDPISNTALFSKLVLSPKLHPHTLLKKS